MWMCLQLHIRCRCIWRLQGQLETMGFKGRGAPFLANTLLFLDLRHGTQLHPPGATFDEEARDHFRHGSLFGRSVCVAYAVQLHEI